MPTITELCRALRNNPTPAERLLWNELRKRQQGNQKFLRQYPISVTTGFSMKAFYIADFYCAEHKLVIEADGPIHQYKQEYDMNRDLVMQSRGLTILRFTNNEINQELDNVVLKINDALL